jgi:phage baseplate assembly protein W
VSKDYGSMLSSMIDDPIKNVLDIASEVGEAIDRNVEDYEVLKVRVSPTENGQAISIYGYIPSLGDEVESILEYISA